MLRTRRHVAKLQKPPATQIPFSQAYKPSIPTGPPYSRKAFHVTAKVLD